MGRPQKYNPSLGFQGNIENALWENQYTNNVVSNNKGAYDIDHLNMEQAMTELDIATIITEQEATALDLRLIEVEEKIKEE